MVALRGAEAPLFHGCAGRFWTLPLCPTGQSLGFNAARTAVPHPVRCRASFLRLRSDTLTIFYDYDKSQFPPVADLGVLARCADRGPGSDCANDPAVAESRAKVNSE